VPDLASAPLGYRPGSSYDEMLGADGSVRPPWQPLLARLEPLGRAGLGERHDEALRLLRENGVTYTIYGDPQGGERLWPLDLLPLLISAEEWKLIERGVEQRARLLNALLADIYGPQRMIAEGHLPPSLLESDAGFLRPCHGITPAGGIYLHLLAVDLARGVDGRWWVLADRTDAPSGAGYALENRSVTGRVLADCLAEQPVAPLAPFFASLRDGLAAVAPQASQMRAAPRIVLLTPGPFNETYVEQAYLAQTLGITLVEGADLTVRDRRVFLKTVGALEPIDVILRRLDGSFSDPLELRPDSALGIAGLTEAARAGNVTIANALGSGILQAAAFKPFLPAVGRALLDEALLLPDLASWWCGGEDERQFVLENMERLVLKPSSAAPGWEPIFGPELGPEERKKVAARIVARPLDFVGQERVALSSAPAWSHGRLEPRPLVLRVFVAAGPDGFIVMPGGLTRISPLADRLIVSMQRGGGSKDTWVLGAPRAAGSEPARSNVVTFSDAAARRAPTSELSSRAASGLFWLGRYAERTDGIVRLLRTLVSGLTDAARMWTARDVEPYLNLGIWLRLMPMEIAQGAPPALVPLVEAALADADHPAGVAANLHHLHRAASGVRDRLPLDCWRAVTAYAGRPPLPQGTATPVQLLLRLDELATLGAALWGAVEEAMPRDAGWRFLELGKRIERAIHLVAMLRGASEAPAPGGAEPRITEDRALLSALLSLTGVRPPAAARPDWITDRPAVLNTVMTSRSDPRSLSFQLVALEEHLAALPQETTASGGAPVGGARAFVGRAAVMLPELLAIVAAPAASNDEESGLRGALARLDLLLPGISDHLAQAYFTYAFARPA
jgi:uncharacterized circularly permuted ATP-grasp superfamily protein/uncharacterized alpha-E superfamily protein